MASILKVDTITGVTTAGSIAITGEGNSTTTNLQQGLAKAWLRATAAAAVSDSLNVSSGTDHGTGDYSFATTNAFNNINYANVWTVYTTAGRNAIRNDSRDATDTLAVEVNNLSGSNVDHATNGTSHGDLA
tara:strand:- start:410 stop:802 length:393 start_codon:yes stop_codon:yes gene_type:complete